VPDCPSDKERLYLNVFSTEYLRYQFVPGSKHTAAQKKGQPVKKVYLYNNTKKTTYRCDDTRDCIVQFWPPDDKHMC